MELFDKIDRFKFLSEKVAQLKADLENLNAELQEAKCDLANSMTDEEITSISRGDFTYSVVAKTKYSKKAGEEEQFYAVLRQNGLGDLIQENVNAMRLNSALNELAEQNDGILPAEFSEVINEYNYLDISKRKKSK